MITQRDDVLDRVAGLLEPTPEALPNFHRRMRRRHRSRQIGAYAMVAAMVAIAVVAISVVGNGPTPRIPADDPTPTEGLGIFRPVAGWVAYQDVAGLWAIDPDTLQDPMEVLGSADARPLGWSRDGTELLIVRTTPRPSGPGLESFCPSCMPTDPRRRSRQTPSTSRVPRSLPMGRRLCSPAGPKGNRACTAWMLTLVPLSSSSSTTTPWWPSRPFLRTGRRSPTSLARVITATTCG